MKRLIYIAAGIILLTSLFPTMNYSAPASGIEIILKSPEANPQQLEQMADIISARLEHFGVEEYELSVLGGTPQLSVRLTDEQLAKQIRPLLTAAGEIEFCEVFSATDFQRLVKSEDWKEWLALEGKEGHAAKLGLIEQQQITPFLQFAQEQYERGQLPENLRFSLSQEADAQNKRAVYALRYGPAFTPIVNKEALATIDIVGSEYGSDRISLQFSELGSKRWAKATHNNISRPIAIVIDGWVCSTPVVNEEMSSGRAMITGHFTAVEVKLLSALLSTQTLPLQMQWVEVRQ